MVFVEEHQRSEILQALRKDYAGRDEFVVGFSGYEPFVTANGAPKKAALIPFFEELSREIERPLRYKKTTWGQFPGLFQDETIDTMLEPIIPSRERSTYVVIPYLRLTTNVLVIPEWAASFVEAGAKVLRGLTESLNNGSIVLDKFNMDVAGILRSIANQSANRKIGVTRGVLEQDILAEYGVQAKVWDSDDIESNIIKALSEENKTFFFADHRSARNARLALLDRDNEVRTRIIHLFRENPPLSAECGFAVNTVNQPLARYFAYKCKFELPRIHELLSREIPANQLDGTDFRLLENSEVRDFPITRYGHSQLIRPDVGTHALPGPSTSKHLLGMGQESSSNLAHVTLNIEGVDSPLSFDEMAAITKNWDATNKRRSELIDQKISKQITPQDDQELSHLQKLAGAKRQLVMPLPIKELAEIEADLRKRGLWPQD